MSKRRKLLRAVMVALTGWLVAATAVAQEKIKAATTIGMVADLVKQVGGDRVEVDQLMEPWSGPASLQTHIHGCGPAEQGGCDFL